MRNLRVPAPIAMLANRYQTIWLDMEDERAKRGNANAAAMSEYAESLAGLTLTLSNWALEHMATVQVEHVTIRYEDDISPAMVTITVNEVMARDPDVPGGRNK